MLELSGRHSLPRTFQLLAVPRTLERKPAAKFQPPSTTPANQMLAEREGFEPSKGVNPYSLSRGAPSAARPPLQIVYRTLIINYLTRLSIQFCENKVLRRAKIEDLISPTQLFDLFMLYGTLT